MNTCIAWIDDVHLLTVKSNNISSSLHKDELPTVYWVDKNKSFQVKVERVLDDHTVTMNVSEELPLGENFFSYVMKEVYPFIHEPLLERVGLMNITLLQTQY
ncbi:hypothetical protein ACI2OX_06965 [Bacillus sp. N9]